MGDVGEVGVVGVVGEVGVVGVVGEVGDVLIGACSVVTNVEVGMSGGDESDVPYG